jgi:hypothetical protein
MHIDDLMAMVEDDIGKPLRRDLVDWEASRNQSLHQKYRKILYLEKVELDRMKLALEPLRKAKREYYSGKTTDEVFPLVLEKKKKTVSTDNPKILKDELSLYIDADPDVIQAREYISQQAEKVEYIKDTLDTIRNRSFALSNIVNFLRFKHGLDNLGQVLEIQDPDYEKD